MSHLGHTDRPTPQPAPPACPSCGAKMALVGIDPNQSKYTNLDQWSVPLRVLRTDHQQLCSAAAGLTF